MNKVVCPWCGEEMKVRAEENDGDFDANRKHFAVYHCNACDAYAPSVYRGSMKSAMESAYEIAKRRPPNKPLTKEQIASVPDKEAVYVYLHETGFDTYELSVRFASEAKRGWLMAPANIDWFLCFRYSPTSEDIEAARRDLSQFKPE